MVDGFVFWTKDPSPMIPRLSELDGYSYYFTFTITPYDYDIEPGFADKNTLIQTFRNLSLLIGAERVIWRYDPILISKRYSKNYHISKFSEFAEKLKGYTRKCVISFVDEYRAISKSLESIGSMPISISDMYEIGKHMSKAALNNDMVLATCSETANLSPFGIAHNCCIDAVLLSRISGKEIKSKKDRNQRISCGCAKSLDIGQYDTCFKGCLYCYANRSNKTLGKSILKHDPSSPFLIV